MVLGGRAQTHSTLQNSAHSHLAVLLVHSGSSGDQQPFKVKAEEFEEGELPRATGVVVAAPIQQHPGSLEALTKAWGTAQQVSTAAQRETSVQLAALTAAAAAQKSDIATLGAKLDALAAAHPAPQAAPPGQQEMWQSASQTARTSPCRHAPSASVCL